MAKQYVLEGLDGLQFKLKAVSNSIEVRFRSELKSIASEIRVKNMGINNFKGV